jgi:hypothetical protein
MANQSAFLPLGNTFAIDVPNGSSSTPVQITTGVTTGIGGATNYLISVPTVVNLTAVWVMIAPSSTNAAVVASGTPAASRLFLPGQSRVLSGPPNAWVAAAGVGATVTITVVPGEGL